MYDNAKTAEAVALNEAAVIMEKTYQSQKTTYRVIKRVFDICVSIIGLVFLIPISIIVKIAYMATGDFHSIFYTQQRIGKDGKQFKFYKFRTMVPNADEVLKEILRDPSIKKEWEENQKIECDPRIMKAGKILRKTSLDELPQMLNILIGDMSLVGPRPLVPGELDAHEGLHYKYEAVKPGVTSWWASHGRSDTTYEERLNLEYYYVENCSLWLDIKCIFATVKAVITKTGAV